MTLNRAEIPERIAYARTPRKLPAILSADEVVRFLEAVPSLKARTALTTAYAAGLRASETVSLRVADIDSGRMVIQVLHGKGGKNRTVMPSAQLLRILRSYWRLTRPEDRFTCPAGQALERKQVMNKDRCVLYAAKPDDCAACPLKPRSTTAARRLVTRHFDEDALNRMNERATPEMMRKRRCAAEHPFGTLKRKMAGGRFLTRNLMGTRTEMALSVLAYNTLRTINMKHSPA